MHEFCHRCGNELPSQGEASSFCPHCGAPQLYFAEREADSSEGGFETTGNAPPPRPPLIDWRSVIRCAFIVGIIAAALSIAAMRVPVLSMVSSLWTVSASIIALGLYQRSRPTAWMDGRIGARIGLVVGLVLITCLGVGMAATGLVARFALHNMGGFDAQLANELHAQIERTTAASPQPAEVLNYLRTPEFRAGIMLMGFAMVAAILLTLSTVGGALSGMLRRREA